MTPDPVLEHMREIIRQSEINAVAREMRSGKRPHLGQLVDYHIEARGRASCLFDGGRPSAGRPSMPFRLVVEQWHLEAANQLLDR